MLELLIPKVEPYEDYTGVFEATVEISTAYRSVNVATHPHLLYRFNKDPWLSFNSTGNRSLRPNNLGLNTLRIKLKPEAETYPISMLINGRVTSIVSIGEVGISILQINSSLPFTVPTTVPPTLKRVSFRDCTEFNDPNITQWDISSFNSFSYMFQECAMFNQDISHWRPSNELPDTSYRNMFYNAKAFNQDLSGWDVSRITKKPQDFDAGASAWRSDYKPRWGKPPKTD